MPYVFIKTFPLLGFNYESFACSFILWAYQELADRVTALWFFFSFNIQRAQSYFSPSEFTYKLYKEIKRYVFNWVRIQVK